MGGLLQGQGRGHLVGNTGQPWALQPPEGFLPGCSQGGGESFLSPREHVVSGAPGLLQGGFSLQPQADSTIIWMHQEQRAEDREREGEGLVQGHRGCQEQEQDVVPQGSTPPPSPTSALTLPCAWSP